MREPIGRSRLDGQSAARIWRVPLCPARFWWEQTSIDRTFKGSTSVGLTFAALDSMKRKCEERI